jgi:hypothetical protein
MRQSIRARPCGEAQDKNTATWAFSIRPAVPQYWRWTATDSVPFEEAGDRVGGCRTSRVLNCSAFREQM